MKEHLGHVTRPSLTQVGTYDKNGFLWMYSAPVPTQRYYCTILCLSSLQVHLLRIIKNKALLNMTWDDSLCLYLLTFTGLCCMRGDTDYSVYRVAEAGTILEPILLENRHMFGETPTSVCLR